MRVITKKPILRFIEKHPIVAPGLEHWLAFTEKAEWNELTEVRTAFPGADGVRVASGRTVTVFNIGGNKCRLVTAIHYNRQAVFVLKVLTHAEYDRGKWKDQL